MDQDQDQSYCLFDTGLGPCGAAWSATGLTQFQLPEASKEATEARLARSGAARAAPGADIQRLIEQVLAYCEGRDVDFSAVALDFSAVSEFEAAVYRALRSVGWGRTTSYGALAQSVGSPGAARAIGVAMGRNRWPLIVPCHRVLAADRTIGGFSAHGGPDAKRRMLALEGVRLGDEDPPVIPGLLD